MSWLFRGRRRSKPRPPRPDLAPEACQGWRQADVFAYPRVLAIGDDDELREDAAPQGVAVISQSCDVALRDRLDVQVAPVVTLEGEFAGQARAGRRPRYAHLPNIGAGKFADLDCVTTIAKQQLASLPRQPAVTSDEEVRRFAGSVSRKFGRYAFPDEVAEILNPLRDFVLSRAPKEASPVGQVFKDVVELRVESSNGWQAAPYELVLIVVVAPGTLPTFADDKAPEEVPASLRRRFFSEDGSVKAALGEVAQELLLGGPDSAERYWLWEALGMAAARKAEDEVAKLGHEAVVASVTHEIVSADEFPLSRVRKTEILDVDHLSQPRPF
jgi:hypothetical protein